jgi:1,4-alpha-glucan branching enzyme
VILNLTPVPREFYRIGVNGKSEWREVFNSDQVEFFGSGVGSTSAYHSENVSWHGRDSSIQVNLPPLGAVILKR